MYDFGVVGDGIVGSLLVYELIKAGYKVLWWAPDNPKSSLYSGAILNPVAGKHLYINPSSLARYKESVQYYKDLEVALQCRFLETYDIYFLEKTKEAIVEHEYVQRSTIILDDEKLESIVVKESYKINQKLLFSALRRHNCMNATLEHNLFDLDSLDLNNLVYQNYKLNNLVFTQGVSGFDHPLFEPLPFTTNYGNVIIAHIDGLILKDILDFGFMRMIPLGNQHYWCGGNYIWRSPDAQDKIFFEQQLLMIQKKYFPNNNLHILNHEVVPRPTIAGQQPLIQKSYQSDHIFRINGLGTRGFSYSPTLVQQFVKNLCN